MNAVVALCHFCELHGPSILFCTQSFHDSEGPWPIKENNENPLPKKSWYGPPESLQRSNSISGEISGDKAPDTCEGCTSMTGNQKGFISNDHEARVSYISGQHPLHPEVFSMVRHACVRSLSCEVCPGMEGPIFFGDNRRGHVLSHTFFMKDSQARGFQRWFSMIVVMMDKTFLLNSWQFLVKNFQNFIKELQDKAKKVCIMEQSESSQRALRFNRFTRVTTPNNFRRQRGNAKGRSLTELTNDKNIFSILHLWFTWILQAGASRLSERLVEGLPSEDTIIQLEKEETEDGFIRICTNKDTDEIKTKFNNLTMEDDQDSSKDPRIESLRELFNFLGKEKFRSLAHHVLIGNQIIMRGNFPELMKSFILCIKEILPRGCYHPIFDSPQYEDSWKCNFLSLQPDVVIPSHVMGSELYLIVDFRSKEETLNRSGNIPLLNFCCSLFSNAKLPEKIPHVLSEIERIIQDQLLSDSAVLAFLVALKEEWMNKVKVLFAFSRAGQRTQEETNKLLQVLGAQEHDKQLLKFWMTGLSMQYKTHVLSTSIQQGSVQQA
ncbi:folliculin-like [Centruroides sculpturatus]|uniref:folliculin-like n=1 Tax=Centruroides sculpturatus TaxID=218467 RepID=UPI000C6C9065|nr:folliculin-like [Centruroides sculpturatus]